MSKGLEALDFIFDDLRQFEEHFLYGLTKEDKERYETIKKELKALEIIKNKSATNTNIWLVVCTRTYEDYESFVENKDHKLVRLEHNILTKQEYELLKEVLDNGL